MAGDSSKWAFVSGTQNVTLSQSYKNFDYLYFAFWDHNNTILRCIPIATASITYRLTAPTTASTTSLIPWENTEAASIVLSIDYTFYFELLVPGNTNTLFKISSYAYCRGIYGIKL